METRRRRTTTGALGVVLPVLLASVAAGCGDDDGAQLSPEATSGRRIVTRSGCASCHGADGDGGIGPPWAGTVGTEVELEDGTTVTVDEAYLTRSIAEPGAEVHAGFTVQMPANDLSDEEIADVVAYIVELGAPPTEAGP